MRHQTIKATVALVVLTTLPLKVLPSQASQTPPPGIPAVDVLAPGREGGDDAFDAAATTGGGTGSGSGAARQRHTYARVMIPVCPGNTVFKVGADAGCEDAVRLCRDHGQAGFMVWTYVGPPDVAHPLPGQLTPTGQRCVAEREANDPGTAPVFGEREFRRLPLPPGGLRIEPSGRPLLATMPMNAYVEAETLTFRTRLLGVDIDVEATPTRFSWSFGDGGTLVTEDPGHPYPAMTTTHTYKALGHFRVTLATTWSGRYRISGSTEWLPVDGTATVASPPVEVEVIEARAVLVP